MRTERMERRGSVRVLGAVAVMLMACQPASPQQPLAQPPQPSAPPVETPEASDAPSPVVAIAPTDPAAVSPAATAAAPVRDATWIPHDLPSAVAHVEVVVGPLVRAHMLEQPTAEDCASSVHMGFGMWIRNTWGLWRGGPLQTDLQARGFTHPDDMSGVILQCWCHDQRGETCDVDAIQAEFAAYWEQMRDWMQE